MKLEFFNAFEIPEPQRDQLFRKLHTLILLYFPRAPYQHFLDQYLYEGIECCRGVLLKEGDNIRGFQLVASMPVTLHGQKYTVLRSVVAKDREHNSRGSRSFERFGPRELIRQALRAHLQGREPWLIAQSAGPVTYLRLSRYFPAILPPTALDADVPSELRATFDGLADLCHMRTDHPEGWSMSEGPYYPISDHELQSWKQRPEPALRRFFKECPRAGQGQVLVFAVPLTLTTLLSLGPRTILTLLNKRRRARHQTQASPQN
ncbi:hypothetical protein DL240_03600 [Lujinxingia litoralis]|uniref:Uncharacterized protein n=1 Tax=Lujinxingia litoralis TaxID=2211119 RepID=A0A328CBA2_9DELT|nr:hypothetical protein [Lujinxingia litoralis]RAL25308.1 hypothetical protein DL240_03600 [Lujinxingia litoralis]